jgi:hypothetical protein
MIISLNSVNQLIIVMKSVMFFEVGNELISFGLEGLITDCAV